MEKEARPIASGYRILIHELSVLSMILLQTLILSCIMYERVSLSIENFLTFITNTIKHPKLYSVYSLR